ncbi:FtsX-like permease family protein [Corallococcus praedator]|uniref:FtsX-like permease family protein n=1 Tax=Corallococcus praedator TaxID=2316724 RepID=A0ABX9QRL6_9BACT|nr:MULTISPECIES: ABC transporter permease [Corallococcus]RKH33028.1 FtsX-like permease family protein [Corallococcus sp. CA031C]RKI17297.1 FtsX-like permease family protein [Corallococcus praedator]
MSLRVDVYEGARIALFSLAANRLRTGLTTLGIGIGVATLLAIVGIIQGLNSSFERQLASLGPHTVVASRFPWVMTGDWWMYRKRKPLTVQQVEQVRLQATFISHTSPHVQRQADVAADGEQVSKVEIAGVTQDYQETTALEVKTGRFLTPEDDASGQAVAVLGSEVVAALFPKVPALGRQVRIEGRAFRVVGTLSPKGRMLDTNQDLRVFVPFRTFVDRFGQEKSLSISMKVDRPEHVQQAEQQLVSILRRVRGTPPGQPDDFTLNRPEMLANTYAQLTGALYGVAVGVGLICLLVGGIGIMNIMLVSVRERTREIGVRRALGAHRRTIILQFLMEASAVSALGGTLGTAVGLAAAQLVSLFSPLAAAVQPLTVVSSILFSAVVGLLFGIWPAARAANLDPVEALRYE